MSKKYETVTIPKEKWDSICRRIKKQDATIAEQAKQLQECSCNSDGASASTRNSAHIKQVLFAGNLIVEFSDKTAAILPISSNDKNAIRADLLMAVLVHNMNGYDETAKHILQQVNEIAEIYSGLFKA